MRTGSGHNTHVGDVRALRLCGRIQREHVCHVAERGGAGDPKPSVPQVVQVPNL